MIRDRIRELRRVPASTLRPNPKNWRTHPSAQRDALGAMLERVGIADAVLARETADGTLELVDGHLRTDMLGDALVPVLVLDVTEAEADQILVTLDPLASMAEADGPKLADLLAGFQRGENAGLDALLEQLATNTPMPGQAAEPSAEWQDMPEFSNSPKAMKTIHVHFRAMEDVARFAQIIGMPLNERTSFIWFP